MNYLQLKKQAILNSNAQKKYTYIDGYILLNSLVATGQQYIDTGLQVNSADFEMDIDFQYLSKIGAMGGCIFGCENGSTWIAYNGGWFLIGATNYWNSGNGMDIVQNKEYSWHLTGKDNVFSCDELTRYYTPRDTGRNLFLFADNANGVANQFTNSKISHFKLTNAGEVVSEMFPVLDQKTNNAGLYDVVRSKFYPSNTNTKFLYD